MNIYDITGLGPKLKIREKGPSDIDHTHDPELDDMSQFNPDSFDKDGVVDPIKMRQGVIDNHGWPVDIPNSQGSNVPGTPIIPLTVTKNINLDLDSIEQLGDIQNIDISQSGDSLSGDDLRFDMEKEFSQDDVVDDKDPEWLTKLKVLAGIPTTVDGSDLDIGIDALGLDGTKGVEIVKPF